MISQPANSPTSSKTLKTKPKAPVFVIVIAWLMLLDGIGSLLITAPLLLIGGLGKSGTFFGFGGLTLLKGAGFIVMSFGLRRMRKWALHAFTVLTVLLALISTYSFITSSTRELTGLVDPAIQALALTYFWMINKKFT